ncbi:MAG: ribonuclease HII [Proteobacteria bacterium]|nr:ribonuclease HII [Pseudomonadota bacterium]
MKRRPSLAVLEARLAAAERDPGRLEALLAELEADSRAGARALAERFRARRRRSQAERERVAALLALRDELHRDGARTVAGVDEVGMGPLAGPVVAAAVVLDDEVDLPGLDDSKKKSPRARARLERAIREQARAVSVAEVSASEIDRLNIYRAGLEAMRRALVGLRATPDHVLVDARTIPGVAAPQTPLVNGDARDGSIAAASIVAKVHRDALMERMDRLHPGYGFTRHKGYATAEHLEALRRMGPSPIHRASFAPVKQLQPPA